MNRAGLSCVIVAALMTVTCGSNDGASQTPTGPTTTPPPTTSPAPTTPSCAPSTPTGLAMTLSGSTTRVFTWNTSSDAADYFIQIGTSSGSGDLIYTNTSQTTYTWTGQNVTTAWYYARVHARNSCGSSNPSNELQFH